MREVLDRLTTDMAGETEITIIVIKKVESIIIAIVLIQILLGILTETDADDRDHQTEVPIAKMTTGSTVKSVKDQDRLLLGLKLKSKNVC